MPNANPSILLIVNLLGRRTAIEPAFPTRQFQAEMAEPVPLRTRLGIEMPVVVPGNPFVIGDLLNIYNGGRSTKACDGYKCQYL